MIGFTEEQLASNRVFSRLKAKSKRVLGLMLGLALSMSGNLAHAGNLTIESWRTDDADVWNTKIIPVFQKSHPDIRVLFKPTKNVDYDKKVKNKLKDKVAGDLITCRPFDPALELFSEGYLLELSTKVNLSTYRTIAKAPWSTDDGSAVFCLPLAVVSTGFFYNKKIFNELGLVPPQTEEELFDLLKKIKASSNITPIAFGTKDKWESADVLMAEIGPDRWEGEKGRRSILKGELKFTDSTMIDTWRRMQQLIPYLPANLSKISYDHARLLFVKGRAAILPAGSWDISYFESMGAHNIGAFRYPVANGGDPCYLTNHLDAGIGINANSTNQEDAVVFLNWLSTKEFADLFAGSLTGFYPLSSFPTVAKSPLVNELISWRKVCKSTLRINSQFLERGPTSFEELLWDVNASVLNGTMTPEAAGAKLQQHLDAWFYDTFERAKH